MANVGLRFGVRLGIRVLLRLDLTADDKLADIILLRQIEEFANFGSALGSKTLGENGLSQARQRGVTLLDDDQREDSNVGTDDAATHGLALALTSPTRAVAGVAVGEKKADTIRKKDTLLHGESLLVVATSDAEDVSLELIADGVTRNLLRNSLFVEDTAETAL